MDARPAHGHGQRLAPSSRLAVRSACGVAFAVEVANLGFYLFRLRPLPTVEGLLPATPQLPFPASSGQALAAFE